MSTLALIGKTAVGAVVGITLLTIVLTIGLLCLPWKLRSHETA